MIPANRTAAPIATLIFDLSPRLGIIQEQGPSLHIAIAFKFKLMLVYNYYHQLEVMFLLASYLIITKFSSTIFSNYFRCCHYVHAENHWQYVDP